MSNFLTRNCQKINWQTRNTRLYCYVYYSKVRKMFFYKPLAEFWISYLPILIKVITMTKCPQNAHLLVVFLEYRLLKSFFGSFSRSKERRLPRKWRYWHCQCWWPNNRNLPKWKRWWEETKWQEKYWSNHYW